MQQGVGCASKVSFCSSVYSWKIPFRCLLRRTSVDSLAGVVFIKMAGASAVCIVARCKKLYLYNQPSKLVRRCQLHRPCGRARAWKSSLHCAFRAVSRKPLTTMFVIFFGFPQCTSGSCLCLPEVGRPTEVRLVEFLSTENLTSCVA